MEVLIITVDDTFNYKSIIVLKIEGNKRILYYPQMTR